MQRAGRPAQFESPKLLSGCIFGRRLRDARWLRAARVSDFAVPFVAQPAAMMLREASARRNRRVQLAQPLGLSMCSTSGAFPLSESDEPGFPLSARGDREPPPDI